MGQRHLPPQPVPARFLGVRSRHFHQSVGVIHDIHRVEGWSGFFRLGPSLSGVVPAMALKFYVYGKCKRLGAAASGKSSNRRASAVCTEAWERVI